MKELKKLLAEQAPAVLPDERVKQNIRRELGYEAPAEREATYAHGGTAAVRGKKTLWIAVAAGCSPSRSRWASCCPSFYARPRRTSHSRATNF